MKKFYRVSEKQLAINLKKARQLKRIESEVTQ